MESAACARSGVAYVAPNSLQILFVGVQMYSRFVPEYRHGISRLESTDSLCPPSLCCQARGYVMQNEPPFLCFMNS